MKNDVEFYPGMWLGAGLEEIVAAVCLETARVKCLEDAVIKCRPRSCLPISWV